MLLLCAFQFVVVRNLHWMMEKAKLLKFYGQKKWRNIIFCTSLSHLENLIPFVRVYDKACRRNMSYFKSTHKHSHSRSVIMLINANKWQSILVKLFPNPNPLQYGSWTLIAHLNLNRPINWWASSWFDGRFCHRQFVPFLMRSPCFVE